MEALDPAPEQREVEEVEREEIEPCLLGPAQEIGIRPLPSNIGKRYLRQNLPFSHERASGDMDPLTPPRPAVLPRAASGVSRVEADLSVGFRVDERRCLAAHREI